MASSPWMNTAAACQRLGISRWVLATARAGGQLRKGHHWKVKNPTAQRLTYLWHVERLEKWQSSVTVTPREQLDTGDQAAAPAADAAEL